MEIVFDWDHKKDLDNFQKHGVSFEVAKSVWKDPHAIETYDLLHSVDEDRFIKIGVCDDLRLLVVVFYERSNEEPGSEKWIIRLISARTATSKESEFYEKGI